MALTNKQTNNLRTLANRRADQDPTNRPTERQEEQKEKEQQEEEREEDQEKEEIKEEKHAINFCARQHCSYKDESPEAKEGFPSKTKTSSYPAAFCLFLNSLEL